MKYVGRKLFRLHKFQFSHLYDRENTYKIRNILDKESLETFSIKFLAHKRY